MTGTLKQSDWGREVPKPTRLTGRLPGLCSILSIGVPSFNDQGRYLGPLPENPATKDVPLIGKEDGKFLTASAADWPSQLCECLAKLITEHLETCDPEMKSGRQGKGSTSTEEQPSTTCQEQGRVGVEADLDLMLCTRRKVTLTDFVNLSSSSDLIYIGRGNPSRGTPRSTWANHIRFPRSAAETGRYRCSRSTS